MPDSTDESSNSIKGDSSFSSAENIFKEPVAYLSPPESRAPLYYFPPEKSAQKAEKQQSPHLSQIEIQNENEDEGEPQDENKEENENKDENKDEEENKDENKDENEDNFIETENSELYEESQSAGTSTHMIDVSQILINNSGQVQIISIDKPSMSPNSVANKDEKGMKVSIKKTRTDDHLERDVEQSDDEKAPVFEMTDITIEISKENTPSYPGTPISSQFERPRVRTLKKRADVYDNINLEKRFRPKVLDDYRESFLKSPISYDLIQPKSDRKFGSDRPTANKDKDLNIKKPAVFISPEAGKKRVPPKKEKVQEEPSIMNNFTKEIEKDLLQESLCTSDFGLSAADANREKVFKESAFEFSLNFSDHTDSSISSSVHYGGQGQEGYGGTLIRPPVEKRSKAIDSDELIETEIFYSTRDKDYNFDPIPSDPFDSDAIEESFHGRTATTCQERAGFDCQEKGKGKGKKGGRADEVQNMFSRGKVGSLQMEFDSKSYRKRKCMKKKAQKSKGVSSQVPEDDSEYMTPLLFDSKEELFCRHHEGLPKICMCHEGKFATGFGGGGMGGKECRMEPLEPHEQPECTKDYTADEKMAVIMTSRNSSCYYIPALETCEVKRSEYQPDKPYNYSSKAVIIPEAFSGMLPQGNKDQPYQPPSQWSKQDDEATFLDSKANLTESELLMKALETGKEVVNPNKTYPLRCSPDFYPTCTDAEDPIPEPEILISNYFSERMGAFNEALNRCKNIIDGENDGAFQNAWVLTEITHWDTEQEKIVILCEHSLFTVKYNFINHYVVNFRRIYLKQFRTIDIGDLRYPRLSLMPTLNDCCDFVSDNYTKVSELVKPKKNLKNCNEKKVHPTAVCCKFSQGKWISMISPVCAWNPWSKSMPFMIFTSHPLFFEDNADVYSVDAFLHSLQEFFGCYEPNEATHPVDIPAPEFKLKFHRKPIVIDNYFGLCSVIHNANSWGYNKARGMISF